MIRNHLHDKKKFFCYWSLRSLRWLTNFPSDNKKKQYWTFFLPCSTKFSQLVERSLAEANEVELFFSLFHLEQSHVTGALDIFKVC